MAVEFVSREVMPTYSSSDAQVSARARWSTGGRRFSAKSPGGDMIKIDDAVNRITAKLIARVGPAVSRAINTHLAPVAQRAFDDWPVRTGLSKSQLLFAVTVAGDRRSISATIVNRAPYAWAILRGRVVRDLIFRPGREASVEMQRDIATDLARR